MRGRPRVNLDSYRSGRGASVAQQLTPAPAGSEHKPDGEAESQAVREGSHDLRFLFKGSTPKVSTVITVYPVSPAGSFAPVANGRV